MNKIEPTVKQMTNFSTPFKDDDTQELSYNSDNEENTGNFIPYAVFKSTNFTSKLVNKCELTGKYYNNKDLILDRLTSSEQINNHHCYGCIQYHPDNKELFKEANLYFEYFMNLIHKHSWQGLKIKIERSNGDILDTNIHENSYIRLLNNNIVFYVEFFENGETFNKSIHLLDYYSERRKKTDKGILSLNPEFLEKKLILYIDKHPEWMNSQRKEWIELFNTELKKTGINYSFIYR